jgi:hypothetical protein
VKRVFKFLLKVLLWLTILTVVVVTALAIYTDGLWKNYYSEDRFDEIATLIDSSSDIPESFRNTLEKIYPNIFTSGYNYHLFQHLLYDDYDFFCPSQGIAHLFPIHAEVGFESVIKGNLTYVSFIWELERRVSQESCMSALIEKNSFGFNTRGLDQTCEEIFNTTADSLTINQQLELILNFRNPIRYDKNHRPELVDKKINKLRSQIGLDEVRFVHEVKPVSCDDCIIEQNRSEYLIKISTTKAKEITRPTIFTFFNLYKALMKYGSTDKVDSLPSVLRKKDRQAIYKTMDFTGNFQSAYQQVQSGNIQVVAGESLVKHAVLIVGNDTLQINCEYFKNRDGVIVYVPGKKPLLIDYLDKQGFCDGQKMLKCYLKKEKMKLNRTH